MKQVFCILFVLLNVLLYGQETGQFIPFNHYQVDKGNPAQTSLFGVAYKDAERQHRSYDHELLYAYWSKEINENRAEDLLIEQERLSKNPYDVALIQTVLASIYFDKQSYSKAYGIYKGIDDKFLDEQFLNEYYFKMGYLSLVNYTFDESITFLNKGLKRNPNPYKQSSVYYRGMSNYFLGNYEETTRDFESLGNVAEYKPYLPYYLSQIYFTQGKYEKVISYGKDQLQSELVENRFEIEKLIGQSYFKQSNFANAIIHFNIYEQGVGKLNKEEFYQIAYTNYQLGKFAQAIPLFLEIKNEPGELGQIINYYLANCYLKNNDKQSALAAFKNTMGSDADPILQSTAKLNYAKLAYELDNDRLAIKTLAAYQKEEANYQEAQNLLGDILLRSNDYETAMITIEQLPSKSSKVLEAYQNLAFKSALNHVADNDLLKALTFFQIAEETPGSTKVKIESTYWLAKIYHKQKKSSRSREFMDKLFQYPEVKNYAIFFDAKYLSAYQQYNDNKIKLATIDFQEAERAYNLNENSNQVYQDVLTRLGDCFYISKDYQQAKNYYGKANSNVNPSLDYVLFQLGNVEAALGNKYEAILAMDDLVAIQKNSQYVDDALYFNAQNYQSLGKPTAALGEYEKIIALENIQSEYYVSSLLRSALISYNNGDMKSAMSYYQNVFQSNATGLEKQEALKALEEIYVTDLNDPQSYFDFAKNEAGLELDDFSKDSLSYSVADSKFKSANYREAIIGYDKYLSNFPTGYYSSESKYFRGESYSLLKEYSDALSSYEESLLDSDGRYYAQAVKKAALIAFNHNNDFGKSSEYGMKALNTALTESERKDFFEIAVVSLYNIKDYENLLIVSEEMIAKSSLEDFEIAKVNFYKGNALLQLSRKDDAIMAFNKVVQYSKNNQAAEASFKVAQIFFESGNLDKAESQALETTKRAANYPSWVARSLILLSDIYLKKEDSFNAQAAIDAVLENYTSDQNITKEAMVLKQKIIDFEKANSRIKEDGENGIIELDIKKN